MYSADSGDAQKSWPINPASYQGMSNEEVDWAALAQQWIQMKEAGPPPMLSNQNPPNPNVNSQSDSVKPLITEENLKKDSPEESNSPWKNISAPVAQQAPNPDSWTWKNQSPWDWNNSWSNPASGAVVKPTLLPTPNNYEQTEVPVESPNDNTNFTPSLNSQPQNEYSPNYWNSSSKSVKPHNRRYSKVNIPRSAPPPIPPPVVLPTTPEPIIPPMDAAKRKQLPAWIRDGLEKMERDKQRQLERDKEKEDEELYPDRLKPDEETMEIIKDTIIEQRKSKFENNEGEFSDDDKKKSKKEDIVEAEPMTREEMELKVRRTMTEILLKVTNSEIEKICFEELQRCRVKSKASSHRVSAPSGANVTAKLGLGVYGGDSGSSSDENDGHGDRDSDLELKESIRKRKFAFAQIEKEIEGKLMEAANRRERRSSTRSASPDNADTENQVDARLLDTRAPANQSAPPHSKPNSNDKHNHSSGNASDASEKRSKSKRKSFSDSEKSSRNSSWKKKSQSRSGSDDRRHKSKRSRRSRSRSVGSVDRRRKKNYDKEYSRSRAKLPSSTRSRRSRSRSPPRYPYGRRVSEHARTRQRSGSYSKSSRRSRSPSNGKRPRRRSRSSSIGRGKRSYRY